MPPSQIKLILGETFVIPLLIEPNKANSFAAICELLMRYFNTTLAQWSYLILDHFGAQNVRISDVEAKLGNI